MKKHWAVAAAAALGLAACEPAPLADSAAGPVGGVGFGNYEAYLAERQAREERQGLPGLTASDLAAAGIGVTNSVAQPVPQSAPASDPAAAPATAVASAPGGGAAASGPTSLPQPTHVAAAPLAAPGIDPTAAAPVPARVASPGPSADPVIERASGPRTLSDEQDFAAVSARETIESDAERRARLQAQRVQVAPAQVPAATAAEGADIVAYALNTSHSVGESLYPRTLPSKARARRVCGRYAGADLAQRAFLEAGGPYRDRLGIDPDGDGFACAWTPAPFRAARG